MRRLAFLAIASLFAVGLVHCVGDDPATGSNPNPENDAATTDAAAGDATTDAAIGDASTGDAHAIDSGIVDSCIGFSDCPPNLTAASSLQLWLRGNIGTTCSSGRLTNWKDQSGKARDATPGTNDNGDAGTPPQCAGQINGQNVLTFTAPPEPDGGEETEFFDETLNVDLSFLVDTDYTIVVAHERAIDGEFGMISTDDSLNPSKHIKRRLCEFNSSDPRTRIGFGFEPYAAGSFGTANDQACMDENNNADFYAPSTVQVDELFFSQAKGHAILENGSETDFGVGDYENDLGTLDSVNQGVIGRGYDLYGDTRYQGKIAEIIAFSAALSTADRLNLETYLKRQWGFTF